jgi:hypothetical protein
MALEEEPKKETPKSLKKGNKTKKEKKNKKEKKTKKKSKIENIETTSNDMSMSTHHDDSDHSDDEGLFDIMEKWAETKESEVQSHSSSKTKKESAVSFVAQKQTSQVNPFITPYNPTGISLTSPNAGYQSRQSDRNRSKSQFSLHITNVPYNATKEEIELVFSTKGCEITSTRLVYNYHTSRKDESRNRGNAPKDSNGFTGVAFVDFANEKSYRLGLELDKSNWKESGEDDGGGKGKQKGRGWRRRRINVRPTKTKEELADIVSNTKEKMMSQKEEYHKVRNDRLERGENEMDGKQGGVRMDKERSDLKKKTPKAERARGDKKRKHDTVDGKMSEKDVSSSLTKKEDTKQKAVTKKERAKKAAILMAKKRKS